MAELVLHNGRITTLDAAAPEVSAMLVRDGVIHTTGSDEEVLRQAAPGARSVDIGGRRVIPGLNDSHTHLIRGGLNFNLELRWEHHRSLADALRALATQADRTPAPQWVRVIGGWSEFQFAERRMPTLAEINAAAPDVPVFILHLYGRALLNRAALDVLGFDKHSVDPPGGEIERDERGNPTGLLIARPSALILYSTLSRGPRLPREDQVNSTRHYMREMNRLGITSVIDAGGGGQNYPEDYDVIRQLHADGELTVRVAYNLFAQRKGHELDDFRSWTEMTSPNDGDDLLRMNGAGENLAWSAADFENFLEPRPEPAPVMESELEPIVELLADKAWPFRIHATYDETIDRFLTVFERVNGNTPFQTRFIIDHAETISARNIDRIVALGGGIAVQHRMAFQGEYFVDRYGAEAARATPPIRQMLRAGVPVGAGTDATRVASYDAWVGLYWLTTGKTLGGLQLTDAENVLTREEALSLWTTGSAWFSGDHEKKGRLAPGMLADLAVLDRDYFEVEPEQIRSIQSVLTLLGGEVVYAADVFSSLSPPLPPVSPSWSPVAWMPTPGHRSMRTGGAARAEIHSCDGCDHPCGIHGHRHAIVWDLPVVPEHHQAFWGALGCSCFAF